MIRTLGMVLSLLLAGCATHADSPLASVDDYIRANKPLVRTGALSWSAFYKGAYNLASSAGAPGDSLVRLNEMMRYAEQFEAGVMSKDEFDFRRRAVGPGEATPGIWLRMINSE